MKKLNPKLSLIVLITLFFTALPTVSRAQVSVPFLVYNNLNCPVTFSWTAYNCNNSVCASSGPTTFITILPGNFVVLSPSNFPNCVPQPCMLSITVYLAATGAYAGSILAPTDPDQPISAGNCGGPGAHLHVTPNSCYINP